jgi:hypothetical protein
MKIGNSVEKFNKGKVSVIFRIVGLCVVVFVLSFALFAGVKSSSVDMFVVDECLKGESSPKTPLDSVAAEVAKALERKVAEVKAQVSFKKPVVKINSGDGGIFWARNFAVLGEEFVFGGMKYKVNSYREFEDSSFIKVIADARRYGVLDESVLKRPSILWGPVDTCLGGKSFVSVSVEMTNVSGKEIDLGKSPFYFFAVNDFENPYELSFDLDGFFSSKYLPGVTRKHTLWYVVDASVEWYWRIVNKDNRREEFVWLREFED